MAELSSVEELMQRITDEYDSLSRQLKSIATYVEQHRSSLMVDRTSDIAKHCGVQPSAVVRFAQRFGFKGFSEMQALFRQAYTEQANPTQNYQQRIRKLITAKRDLLTSGAVAREFIAGSRSGLEELEQGLDDAQFEAAVNLLLKAENIFVVGVRRSFAVTAYIVYALQHTNKRVHLISGLGGMYREQMRSIRKNDVVIAISFTPYGKETQYCVRVAHHHHAKALIITDSQMSPLARYANALLTVKEGSAFAFRSLTSTICLCQALFIALAYKLELNVEETKDLGGYDD
jgi:DNA-binding MurR/RpiR family transcriptional regulator